MKISKLGLTAYLVAALVVVLDQISKHWILFVYDLPNRVSETLVGPLRLTMVWNRGVSFGLFRADQDLTRWALTGFSLVVAIILAVWARKADRRMMAVALGLVIGGAIGNAIDRTRFGAVADFIDASQLYFPWVFNVADSAITVGVVLLLLDSLRRERPPSESAAAG